MPRASLHLVPSPVIKVFLAHSKSGSRDLKFWSTKGAGIQVERGCGGDWGIMQPARSISATFERGYGKLPKERDTGGFWSSKCLVPTVSGDMGGIWYLKSQFHGLSGALGGICNLGNGCRELSGDVGGICDLGSRIQDLSGDRGWNIRPVENKWKSSSYPWSTRSPATLVLWVMFRLSTKRYTLDIQVPPEVWCFR